VKKIIRTTTLILLILTLAACTGTTSEPEAANPETGGNPESSNENPSLNNANDDGEFSMPTESLLMLGTILLDDTEHVVDANQASVLLPLWKALRSLGESETTAQAEIDAIISQIEDTMTTEQRIEIEAMELTMQDMGSVAEILGLEMGGFGGDFGEITPEMQATREAMRESGNLQRPGGGLGPGGGQGPDGAEMDPTARETAMAERGGTRGARSGINSILLDGLIEFLEAKVQ
jgi:hypothetical protein